MARLERDGDGTWTLVLEPGDDGRNLDHDEALPRYLTALDPAFTRTQEASEFEFILTLLRVRGMQDAGWDPYETTLRAVPAMTLLHESIGPDDANFETARHLQLWVYGHIVEASEPYEILANLLAVTAGERFANQRFPPDGSGRPQPVGRKLVQLTELAEAVDLAGVVEPMREIYDRDLRNAVFHADYTLHGGRVRLPLRSREYMHDEVMRLVNRALAFHEALALLYRSSVASYETPTEIPVHPGFSADPDERAVTIIREGHGIIGLKHNLSAAEIGHGGIPGASASFARTSSPHSRPIPSWPCCLRRPPPNRERAMAPSRLFGAGSALDGHDCSEAAGISAAPPGHCSPAFPSAFGIATFLAPAPKRRSRPRLRPAVRGADVGPTAETSICQVVTWLPPPRPRRATRRFRRRGSPSVP